jgi:hypothetical protein
MTVERRLAALESSLSPTELVLRWLDDAHAFGDLEAYVRSLLTEPPSEGPLDRLYREAENSARAGLRGKRAEMADQLIRKALRETIFRFELVMRINVTAHDLLEREALIDAALSAHLALLTCTDRRARRADPRYLERFATLRDLLALRVRELRAEQDAWAVVEARYLDGHPAIFPHAVTAWDEQVKRTEALVDLADRLGTLDGCPAGEPADPEAGPARVTELVADLVAPAKATALEKVGEGEHSLAIAVAWLRPKLAPGKAGFPVAE